MDFLKKTPEQIVEEVLRVVDDPIYFVMHPEIKKLGKRHDNLIQKALTIIEQRAKMARPVPPTPCWILEMSDGMGLYFQDTLLMYSSEELARTFQEDEFNTSFLRFLKECKIVSDSWTNIVNKWRGVYMWASIDWIGVSRGWRKGGGTLPLEEIGDN